MANAADGSTDHPITKRSDREVVVTLRLPRELHGKLKEIAGERGLTAEIRRRLEASFSANASTAPIDPTFGAALAAIAVAARTTASLRKDAGQGEMGWYWAFAHAVLKLMIALAPEKTPWSAENEQQQLTDQLVGIALGSLGERGIKGLTALQEPEQGELLKVLRFKRAPAPAEGDSGDAMEGNEK